MTVVEAGRKGGRATRDRYGHEHYEAIGRKGGGEGPQAPRCRQEAPRAGAMKKGPPRGSMTVVEAARKGGQSVARQRGPEFYREIGRKGGSRVRAFIAAGRKALGE